jgi:hypothetical protein
MAYECLVSLILHESASRSCSVSHSPLLTFSTSSVSQTLNSVGGRIENGIQSGNRNSDDNPAFLGAHSSLDIYSSELGHMQSHQHPVSLVSHLNVADLFAGAQVRPGYTWDFHGKWTSEE